MILVCFGILCHTFYGVDVDKGRASLDCKAKATSGKHEEPKKERAFFHIRFLDVVSALNTNMKENETILLARSGRLKWKGEKETGESDTVCWQQMWFDLSAERKNVSDPVQRFWQMIGASCITALCHIASNDAESANDEKKILSIALPEKARDWICEAPPMEGGEFLSLDMLQTLWTKLLTWCLETAAQYKNLAEFLKERAPKWQHVGRIFFHLAENAMNKARPFAFLATYTVGLNDTGQPRHVPLSNALKQYIKAQDKPALVRLLAPLAEASKRFPWVQKLVDSQEIYHALPWSPREAYTFLQSAEELQQCGVGIRLPNWWKKRAKAQIKAQITQKQGTSGTLSAESLAHIDLRLAVGTEECSIEELDALLQSCDAEGLVFFRNQWVEVDKEKLQEALSFWKKIKKVSDEGNLSFVKGMRLLAGLPTEGNDSVDEEVVRSWSFAEAGHGFAELLQKARLDVETLEIPGLQATLRPYQKQGVAWLSFLGKLGLGACLADDMGLGKTIQILSFLLQNKGGHPSLLLAPASLLSNWQAEAKRFAPTLRLLLLHGKSKTDLAFFEKPGSFEGYDLVLLSYAGCVRLPWLTKHTWKTVIADEAQAIKNAETKQSRAVRSFDKGFHIALTGTPIENKLSDLWSLFDFINPGLLGSPRSFKKLVKKLEETEEHFAPLRRLTSPYILRRMKTDKTIIDCLPEKTEVPLFCHLTQEQAKQYLSVTKKLEKSLNDLKQMGRDNEEASRKRRVIVLQSIMLLKQICNHPNQASQEGEYDPNLSGKFKALKSLCETIVARQEKVLIFTQFREICEPLSHYIAGIFGCEGLVMHGGVPVAKRKSLVDSFQTPDGPPFFILTLKVGGTGLTLTEANHVIHFDRWWNPAVEDQASDRAFRIGQKKNVLIHKCITQGTVEEKIDALITGKRELAAEILGGTNEISLTSMTDEEICNLVRLDAEQCFSDE